MHSKSVVCAVLAASLLSGPLAFAQGQRGDDRDRRGYDARPSDRPGYRGNAYGRDQQNRFDRGERMPPQYRTRHYIVEDWRGHHLSAPPRGYHWVQSGGDYILVAIATGIILQLLLNN